MMKLRPATAADAPLLLDWFNSPDNLTNARRTRELVALDQHRRWLSDRLADTCTRIYVVERGERPVGQVRLQLEQGRGYLVDVYVVSAARRQGLAALAVKEAIKRLRKEVPRAVVVAEVRLENAASRRLFAALDFVLVGEAEGFVTYTLAAGAKTRAAV